MMLRKALIGLFAAMLCSQLGSPQAKSAELGVRGWRGHPHRSVDVVPWFLVDGATRLGIFPRLYVSEYYPYYIYNTVYSRDAYVGIVEGCPRIARPVPGGWRTVPVCN